MSMHPPPDPDELASDLVDGLLPEDEAARLRSDPAIAARVDAIEAARAALRLPAPSPPGAVDRAVAATFAALDRGAVGTGVAASDAGSSGERPPPVTHLRSVGAPSGDTAATGGPWAPAHRARSRSAGMPWLAAAAAIVVLGLVTLGILSGRSGSDGDQASDTMASAEGGTEAGAGDSTGQAQDAPLSTTEENGDEVTAVPGDGDEAPAASEPTPTTRGAPTLERRQLGMVGSAAELAERIRSGDDAFDEAGGTPDGQATFGEETESPTCAGLTDAGDRSRGEAVYVADAVLDGTPVRVHLYDPGDGELRLVATDESCVDVLDTPYSG